MKINLEDIKFKDINFAYDLSFRTSNPIGIYYCAIVNDSNVFKFILKESYYSPKTDLYTIDVISDNIPYFDKKYSCRIRKEGFIYISDNIDEVKKILVIQ